MLVAIQAQATIAYNYPGGLVANGGSGPYTIGNYFTVNSAINVDQLGIYDSGYLNGGTVSVAIYAVSELDNQLTSASLAVAPVSFSAANPGTKVVGTSTFMKTVGNNVLNPGTYMVVANNYGNSGALPYYDNAGSSPGQISANTGGGALTFEGSYREDGNVALGSSLTDLSDWGFFDHTIPRMAAGNFGFFAIVPEASVFGGVAIALLGLIYVGRSAWLKNNVA